MSSTLPPLPDESETIWRYLDFVQLISIFEREALWFARAALFDDPMEGSLSRKGVNTRAARFSNTELPPDEVNSLIEKQSMITETHRDTAYLNCWHLNNRESMAMWELYSLEGQGVAIKSSVGRVKRALRSKGGKINREDTPVEEELPRMKLFTLGAVQYVDYDEHIIPNGNLYTPLFYKRLSFQHEREFRIATSQFFEFIQEGGGLVRPEEEELENGYYVEIGIEDLVDEIYVSPSSADWFKQLVEMVAEKYGIGGENVTRSNLDEDPVF